MVSAPTPDEVAAAKAEAFRASLEGRTILSAILEPSTDDDGSGASYPGALVLELDDDRVMAIRGWGHDYWGIDLEVRDGG